MLYTYSYIRNNTALLQTIDQIHLQRNRSNLKFSLMRTLIIARNVILSGFAIILVINL